MPRSQLDGRIATLAPPNKEALADAVVERLRRTILYYAELEARNRTAGAALELYFRIAENETRADLLTLARTDLADAVAKLHKTVAQGIKLPVEPASLAESRAGFRSGEARAPGARREPS